MRPSSAVTGASSAFWDFSLRIYALPGIQDECLQLQERHGTNVNLLLFCAFCGARFGAKLSAEDVAEASSRVDAWHAEVTKSLRMARTSAKRFKPDDSSPVSSQIGRLRQAVKRLELAAEQIEHAILEEWWQTKSAMRTASVPTDAIRSNIALLLGRSAEAPALVDAASAYGISTAASPH
jgi:uncharacterized protein (TIGR02444 family)